MFSFLNSTVLFAAAAALIPLIIHLFSRRRVKVIEFSSLRHLKEMQKRQLRRLKIRQLLLLLLRMLIILAVVLAFARPTSRDGAVGSHAAVSAVILLDNSASMNRYVADGDLFEIARKRTRQLLGTFSQSDEVCLLPLDRATRRGTEGFVSAAVGQEELTRLRAGSSRADMQDGLVMAVELLGDAVNMNREVYLVTDRQRNSLPETASLAGADINLYLVDIPIEEIENTGVVLLDFGGQLIQPGHDFDLVATIRNYGSQPTDRRIASLFLDGKRVAQHEFMIDGDSETAVRFTRSVSGTGFHSGYVEISDDKFPGDNRYFFSLKIPDRFNLLLINGDPSAKFISLALVPPASGGQYWSVKEAVPGELSGIDFNQYDVIALVGAPTLAEAYVTRLQSFVQRGKSLFITYGGHTDIGWFNEVWSSAAGVTFDTPVKANFSRAGYYSFLSVDMDHPVFSVFGFEGGKPPEAKFYTLPTMHLRGGARALAMFTGDRPALVEGEYGTGKVMTFTGPISPEYSDLVSHGFFVPFMSRIAEYLALDLSNLDIRQRTGEVATRALLVEGAVDHAVDLVLPDSTIVSVPPEEEKGALVVRTGPLEMAGVYRINHNGREIDRFAVNIDRVECDLATTDIDQFAVALGATEYRRLKSDDQLDEVISGFRIGRELWQVFLWIAVALLAIEMLLARRSAEE